jgi:FixJ family two-component response regulator
MLEMPHHLPLVVYRADAPAQAELLCAELGEELIVSFHDCDRTAEALLLQMGDRVAALIVDLADLRQAVDTPLFQCAQRASPHALRILLHDTLSLDAIRVLLNSGAIDRCFNTPVDGELLRSEIVRASLKLERSAVSDLKPGVCPGVLVVDDEVVATKYLKKQLERQSADFLTYSAASADEALALLQVGTAPIALVISDQRMPGMKGNELLSTLKRMYPGVMRVLTSAYQEVDVALGAVNEGEIFQYLSKPWVVDEVLHCIESALRESARRREQAMQQKDVLYRRHATLLARRRQWLEQHLLPLLPPWAEAATLDHFLGVLERLDTLPPSLASVRAEESGDLALQLAQEMADALALAFRNLSSLQPDPVARGDALAELRRHFARDAGSNPEPVASPWLPPLLSALETLLLASGMDLGDLSLAPSTGSGEWVIRMRAPLSVYTHVLSPLTRVSRQLLAQQCALLQVMLEVSRLGGTVFCETGLQSLRFDLQFVDS